MSIEYTRKRKWEGTQSISLKKTQKAKNKEENTQKKAVGKKMDNKVTRLTYNKMAIVSPFD